MGIFRKVITAGRRITGFLLGPAREIIDTAPGTQREEKAVEQAIGDEAAPWWLAPVRKLWAALLGSILMGLHAKFGWDLTGLEGQLDQFIWTPLIGWLVWRVTNRSITS